MSDLRPVGIPVEIEGVERHFLFTLNVIDEIQEHYGKDLAEVIDNLTDKETSIATMRYLVTTLLNDEAERESSKNLKGYSEKEIGWMLSLDNISEFLTLILSAYGVSLPKPDEDDYPNFQSGRTEELT